MPERTLLQLFDAFIEERFDAWPGDGDAPDVAALLDEFCRLHPEVDAAGLQRRIAAFESNQKRFASALPGLLADLEDAPSSLAEGEILDKYSIIRKLADGGMGEVYLARRSDGQFEKTVALKILSRGLITDSSVQRFTRERQILATLRHPNIAPLLDAGVTEENRPWFVLDYVQGERIDTYCTQHGLSHGEIVALCLKICQALAHAHAQGIIHRDIKPANILVDTRDGVHRPMVLDFGIAAFQDEQAMTRTGQVIGTPGYMSPEQTRGQTAGLDRRSDVFSMGVILYKLLNASHPFSAESITEVNFKVLNDEPPALPRAKVNPDLAAIVYKALQKDPARRYQSMDELSDDLRRFMGGEAVLARRVSTLHRARLKWRRHPVIGLLSMALLLVLGGSAVLFVQQNLRAKKHTETVQKYAFISKEIERKVREQHMLPAHNMQQAYADIEHALQNMSAELDPNDAFNNGPVYATVGQAYVWMNQPAASLQAFKDYAASGFSDPQIEIQYALALAQMWAQENGKNKEIGTAEERAKHEAWINQSFLLPAQEKLKNNLHSGNNGIYLQAHLAYLSGEYADTMRLAEKAFAQDATLYEALQLAGKAALRTGLNLATQGEADGALNAYAQASDYLQSGLQIARSDFTVYSDYCELMEIRLHALLIGNKPMQSETFSAAVEACEQANRIVPGQLKVVLNLAEIYTTWLGWLKEIEQNDAHIWDQVMRYSRRALEIAPNDTDALSQMVFTLLNASGKNNPNYNEEEKLALLNEARLYAQQSIDINDRYAFNWANLADIELTLAGRTLENTDVRLHIDAAVEAYSKAQELLPSYAWLYMLGQCYATLGDHRMRQRDPASARQAFTQAQVYFRDTLSESPDFAPGWKFLTTTQMQAVQVNTELGIDNTEMLQQLSASLDTTCRLYAQRDVVPEEVPSTLEFLTEHNIAPPPACVAAD